jgi:hypothetical protein
MSAAKTMAQAAETTPARLPIEHSDEFSDLASFCSGWRVASRMPFWSAPELLVLRKANTLLFGLLLSFEMTTPNIAAIRTSLDAALDSLNEVAEMLQRIVRV